MVLKAPNQAMDEATMRKRLGRRGEHRKLRLVLKTIGDVALVGMPNGTFAG